MKTQLILIQFVNKKSYNRTCWFQFACPFIGVRVTNDAISGLILSFVNNNVCENPSFVTIVWALTMWKSCLPRVLFWSCKRLRTFFVVVGAEFLANNDRNWAIFRSHSCKSHLNYKPDEASKKHQSWALKPKNGFMKKKKKTKYTML